MANLVGAVPEVSRLLEIDGAHVHLYGKQPRPGRKLGHVTLVGGDDSGRGVRSSCSPPAEASRLAGRLGGVVVRRGAAAGVRVRLEVRLPAAPIGDVRVALGRREIGVPEHLLHAAQVGAALEQVRRERVAQEVRVHALRLEPRLRRELAAGSGTRRRG